MASLESTYLTRLPRDIEGIIVEKLKPPEITIEPQIDPRRFPEGPYIFAPLIKIKSGISIKFELNLPFEYIGGKQFPDKEKLGLYLKRLRKKRGKIDSGEKTKIDLTDEIYLYSKPSKLIFVLECMGDSSNLGVDLQNKENSLILIDKIIGYIEPLLN